MFELFKRIEELAKKRGVSLQKVATDIGLSENYIYNIKNKKTTNMEPIEKIADYFNVSMDYLRGKTNNPRIAKADDEVAKIDFKEVAAESMAFDGKPFDEEDLEFMEFILENHFKNKYKD